MWFPSWSRERSCGRKRKDFPSARVQVSSRLLCVQYQEDPDTRGADAWKCQQQSFLSEFSVFRKVVEATGTCILFCIFFWPQKGAVHIPLKFCMVFFVLFSSLWKISFSLPYQQPILIFFCLLFQSWKYLLIFSFIKWVLTHFTSFSHSCSGSGSVFETYSCRPCMLSTVFFLQRHTGIF